jgi:hypothetical protein
MTKIFLASLLLILSGISAIGGDTPKGVTGKSKEPGLILEMNFDKDTGAVATDTSGLGKHGKISGAKWTAKGKDGGALIFAKKKGVVNAGEDKTFDFGENTDFTISLDMQTVPGEKRGFMFLICKKLRGGVMEPGFTIFLHKNGNPVALITDGFNSVMLVGKESIADGKWHNIILTADRDGDAVFYVDNAEIGRKSMKEVIDISNNLRPLMIGGRGHDGSFRGKIDNVKIYNQVKSPKTDKAE